jgi:hypothetical protein
VPEEQVILPVTVGLVRMNTTPEAMTRDYSVALRVTPTRLRGFWPCGARRRKRMSGNSIMATVQYENDLAMLDVLSEFGTYPIQPPAPGTPPGRTRARWLSGWTRRRASLPAPG